VSDYKHTQEYLAKHRKLHVKRGQRVLFEGKPGKVTDLRGGDVLIRLDGEKHSERYHPTWHLVYLPKVKAE